MYENMSSLSADIESIRNDAARMPGSRELSLVLTKLDEAKMWCDNAPSS